MLGSESKLVNMAEQGAGSVFERRLAHAKRTGALFYEFLLHCIGPNLPGWRPTSTNPCSLGTGKTRSGMTLLTDFRQQ